MHKDLEANEKFNSLVNHLNFGKAAPKGNTVKHGGY